MMENRTPDNLFQTLGPNGSGVADIATTAPTQFGTVTMTPVAMAAPFDMAHTHEAWLTDWHNGAMDRFDNAGCSETCPQYPAETYVQAGDVTPYTHLAQAYTFGDRFFQSASVESEPAHQYLFSGTAQDAVGSVLAEDDNATYTQSAGCGESAASGYMVNINTGAYSRIVPCFEHPTLTDELEASGITWKYYSGQSGAGGFSGGSYNGIWTAPNQINHICGPVSPTSHACTGTDFTSHVSLTSTLTTTQILLDISAGTLANVSWVLPPDVHSDHGQSTDDGGPSYVLAITNAVGGSPYWNNTVVFIIWDDWGGLYDHVPPNVAAGVPNANYPT